jgi:hypothetical protein
VTKVNHIKINDFQLSYYLSMKDLVIKDCLAIIFDRMKNGDSFSGLDLHKWVAELNSAYSFTYPDTVLRVARKYFRALFEVKNHKKSIYVVTKE